MAARLLPGLALLCAAACTQAPEPPPPAPPAYELREVYRARLAALEAEAAAAQEPLPAWTEAPGEEDLDALLADLIGMAQNSRGKMRAAAIEELAAFGPPVIEKLAVRFADEAAPFPERAIAAEVLGTCPLPAAAEALFAYVEKGPAASLRAHAYWHLGRRAEPAHLPRLLLRLRYESDPESALFLASALGELKNFAGLPALRDLAAQAADPGHRQRASQSLEQLVEKARAHGADIADDLALLELWNAAEARALPDASADPAMRLATWRRLGELTSEHFQLRGVDDARFILSRLGAWAAPFLAEALRDRDPHLRLHTAQVLERMGPRAAGALPALIEGLADEVLGPAAAEALGHIQGERAFEALMAAAQEGSPFELRIAALRALGNLGDRRAVPLLRAAFEEAGEVELRRRAALSLVPLGAGDQAVDFLLAGLIDRSGAPGECEASLEAWLAQGAAAQRAGFADALATWRAAGQDIAGALPTRAEVLARRAGRHALLAERAAALLANPPAAGEAN